MVVAAEVTGLRRAAIIMVLLGEEAAAQIYRLLTEEEVQVLTQEIAEMGPATSEAGLEVLEDYYRLTVTQDYVARGGTEFARKLLIKAFGEDGAKHLLVQVEEAAQQSAGKLDSLRKTDPRQLAKFLEGEHPQTVALTLAHLDAKQGSTLLLSLPEEVRAETLRRLALLRRFSPEMAQKVAIILHNRVQSIGEQSRRTYAGLRGVADLLNRLDPVMGKEILEKIEKDDAKLALSIRNLMFTFEDLLRAPEAAIREILANLEKKTLALALRGATEEMKSCIFKSMSSRAVEMLKEDMETMGPVRSKDVTKAQMESVEVARRLEAEGKIMLGSEQEEYVV